VQNISLFYITSYDSFAPSLRNVHAQTIATHFYISIQEHVDHVPCVCTQVPSVPRSATTRGPGNTTAGARDQACARNVSIGYTDWSFHGIGYTDWLLMVLATLIGPLMV